MDDWTKGISAELTPSVKSKSVLFSYLPISLILKVLWVVYNVIIQVTLCPSSNLATQFTDLRGMEG